MGVTKIQLNGETLIDLSNDTATLADVMSGKTIHLSTGEIGTGTASAGIGELLSTTALGSLSTTATSGTNTNKTITLTGYNNYDALIVDISADSPTAARHTSTVSMIYLTGTVSNKTSYSVCSNKWNSQLSSTGSSTSTYQSTTAYGIYVYSASVSNSTMTLSIYYRFHKTYTSTINGSYTARIYGIKLYDLIGG